MGRERIGRLLSVALVPLGVALLALGVTADDVTSAVLGAGTAILGAAYFRTIGRFSDAEFELTGTPSLIANVVQSIEVLMVFVLFTYLMSDFESVTRAFRVGLPSPTYLAYAGVSIGVLLDGVVPYLLQRRAAVGKRLSDSVPARTVGFSFTFGTHTLSRR